MSVNGDAADRFQQRLVRKMKQGRKSHVVTKGAHVPPKRWASMGDEVDAMRLMTLQQLGDLDGNDADARVEKYLISKMTSIGHLGGDNAEECFKRRLMGMTSSVTSSAHETPEDDAADESIAIVTRDDVNIGENGDHADDGVCDELGAGDVRHLEKLHTHPMPRRKPGKGTKLANYTDELQRKLHRI